VTDPFAWLGATMVRFRWPVLAAWLVLLAVSGGLLAPHTPKALKGGGFIDAESESARAAELLDTEFDASTFNNAVVVFRSTAQTADTPAFQDQVSRATNNLSAVKGVRSVQSFYSTGNPLLVSADRMTTILLVPLEGTEGENQELIPTLRDALRDVSLEHYVTGTPALNHDLQVTSEQDLQRAEAFTVPIVLILLLLVFRTVVAALLPLIVGVASIVLALGAMYLITTRTDVSIFALNVTTMIGLGLGIDFSLVVAARFREESLQGRSVSDAVAATMATAGRSITYSALTVLLAMFVLTLLFNLLIVRSISLGVMLVAFTGLLAGLTLLPAVLGILGHRLEWLRVVPRAKPRQEGETGIWYRLSHAIMRRPWVWLGVSLGALLVLALPVRDLRLYGSAAGIMPSRIESTHSVEVMNQVFGPNRLTPIQVVVRGTGRNAADRPDFARALTQIGTWAAADPRNELVVPPFVNTQRGNDTAVITIFSKYDRFSTQHQAFISDLRETILPPARQSGAVAQAVVGGDGAIFVDFRDAMVRRFPFLVVGVTLVTFVMLMMFFQSVFLPLKAILMNFASILATYGVLVAIFQYGWSDKLLGFSSLGGLGILTPPTLFAVLFALSTDYEVFMLSRVKEYFHSTHNNEEAVARGLQNTAGVITAAGLILVGTFGSFATADVVAVKEIGIGLAVGVLLDSTIVRVIMVPASMRLMGNANWWMPAWLRRIVPELQEGSSRSSKVGYLRALNGSLGTDGIVLIDTRALRIGRDESNDLQLFDDRISRFHARIVFDTQCDAHVVVDLGSTNGVYVNGQRIAVEPATTPLRAGDRLDIGGTDEVVLIYEAYEGDPA
jgi:RND superfamily putative drug exporter